MYLKQLVIQGFKSFPDKTVVGFGHDITAIVGPNGSGKSNISDAIRWVMGEQNSRSLRGQKMEDVIFGGTEKRAPVGFAEATLVLDNSDRALHYDADELMVTRRYYRSGESEYYINKQSVRLRDVNELFMDTGLGRDGYSNISQGRIDEILSLKSTDRREIFEEAAGISKYRHRKEETERRLATTQDNLTRIGDKISELELQVGPLRDQAEKAKRYLTYREELKGLEVALWLQSLERLSATARKAEEDYHSAAFILQQEHDALDKLYVTSESLTFDLHNRDLQTDQIRDAIRQAEAASQEQRSRIAVLETNRGNAQSNLKRVQHELEDQDSRSGSISAQIEALEQRMGEIDTQTAALAEKQKQAEEEGRRLADSADDMTKRYLTLRDLQGRKREELSARGADLTAVEESLAQSTERQTQLAQDLQAAQSRCAEAQRALETAQKQLSKAQADITAAQNRINGYRLRSRTRAERSEALQKQATDAGVRLDTVSSRLKLFQEMERELEGYSRAVRTVMQESRRGKLRGIHGAVSMLLRTQDSYTVAIEVALGSAMQNIVVEDEGCAKAAIQYLKRSDNGRATFLPLSVIHGRPLNESGIERCAGFCGVASDLVSCEPRYREIILNLLGRTVVAQDLDAAISIANQFGHRFRIVTLDGQVLNAGGSMTGGSVSRSAGILSRANEIERLQAQQKEAAAALDKLRGEQKEAQRLLEQANYDLTNAETDLRTAEDAALRLQGEEKQHHVLVQALTDAITGSQREQELLEKRIGADSGRRAALQKAVADLQKALEEAEQELSVVSDGQSVASEQSSRLSERLTALRMEAARLEAERATAKLAGQDAAAQARQEELQAALAERAKVEARKTATEKEVQEKNRDILNMERESARLESRKNAAELEEKQILDRLWDTYELTRSSAPAAAAELESTAAGTKRAAELRKKISGLGTPNLGAIDEFARVNERYEYLCGQRDDVLTSKRDLEGIIGDITGQMTDIFVTEFGRINTYFGQTFTEMFGGGKASLELEDRSQPLTCGIEIRVQPPGKQLKTITLLSGGEKAFVAIALYFAILKVRPTPFCMLDEIDAALDDRNVERFAGYLRGFSGKTQFIVITHRRGTMEAADVLYGVTMQEQGISRILHLDLNQMEHQLGISEEIK